MARKVTIVAKINKKTGEVTFEGKGFAGKTCDKEMAIFEDAVGNPDYAARENKPEYYSNTVTSEETVSNKGK